MNKQEYLSKLDKALGALSPDDRENAIRFYDEYIADSGEDETLDTVLKTLGTPEQLANKIIAEMKTIAQAPPAEEKKSHSGNRKAFQSILIDVLSADISVTVGSDFDVRIDGHDPSRIEVTNKDGNLQIRELRNYFRLFSWMSSLNISVTVPRGTPLTSLRIINKSGDLSINGLNSDATELRLMSGDISMNNCALGKFSVNQTSGDLHCSGCSAEFTTIQSISGDSKLENHTSNGLMYNNTSGDIHIWGTFTGRSMIKSISGDITLSLKGASRDYFKQLHMVSGSAKINGYKVKGFTDIDNTHAPNQLEINTVSGDIQVEFSE